MHLGLRKELEETKARWPTLDLGSGPSAAMPTHLADAINEYCARAANRDGRGVRSATVAKVRKTLRHIRSAAGRTTATGTQEAQEARKFLKSLYHLRDFEAMVERARVYAGCVQKLGRHRARHRAVCDAARVGLGEADPFGKVRLERVVSVADLMSIGRHLQVCLARNNHVGRDYHHRLREKDTTEFWQIGASEPLALLEVARDGPGKRGVIMEWGTREDPEPALPRSMLVRVLRELNASGDDIDAFARVGAFWTLRQSRRPTGIVEVGISRYRVWRFRDEVIIHARVEHRGGRRIGWSRFMREEVEPWHLRTRRRKPARSQRGEDDESAAAWDGGWWWLPVTYGRRALGEQELQALMLASKELYDLLAEGADGSTP